MVNLFWRTEGCKLHSVFPKKKTWLLKAGIHSDVPKKKTWVLKAGIHSDVPKKKTRVLKAGSTVDMCGLGTNFKSCR